MSTKSFVCKGAKCESVPHIESEYEVSGIARGYPFKFRVCLLNRFSSNPTVAIALPGIGGDFSVNYRWVMQWDMKAHGEAKIARILDQSPMSFAIGVSEEDLAEIIYLCVFHLRKVANAAKSGMELYE